MQDLRRSETCQDPLGREDHLQQWHVDHGLRLKNISCSGAKLALNGSLPVPTEFELHIPRKGRSYRARLVRRDNEGIGVALPFADARRPTEARLHELELENAQLKARINVLSERLSDLGQNPEIDNISNVEGEGLL